MIKDGYRKLILRMHKNETIPGENDMQMGQIKVKKRLNRGFLCVTIL